MYNNIVPNLIKNAQFFNFPYEVTTLLYARGQLKNNKTEEHRR